MNPELPGATFTDQIPVDLGSGVLLTRLPAWLKSEKILDDLSWYDRTMTIGEAEFAFYTEYAASSLGDPDPAAKVVGQSRQQSADERLRLANVAVWLVKPSWLGFKLVVHAEQYDEGEWVRRQSYNSDTVWPHTNDAEAQLALADFEKARILNNALGTLPRTGAVWTAVRALWKGITESWWEGRYLVLWVAVEALFGPLSPAEITYRLSQRLAFFLATNHAEAETLFQKARDGYGWRSKIVHGLRLQSLERGKSADLMYETEGFLRHALLKILNSAETTTTFSIEKQREAFLDKLVFVTRQT